MQWLRDGLQIIRTAARDRGARGERCPTTAASTSCPAFAGPRRAALGRLRARRDVRPHARRDRAAHIARAALEAIAFQSADVLAAMQKDAGITLTRAARRRRRDGQRPADAVPGRPARRAGRAAEGARDHGARRRLPRRARGRLLEGRGRRRRQLAGRPRLRAGDAARPRRGAARDWHKAVAAGDRIGASSHPARGPGRRLGIDGQAIAQGGRRSAARSATPSARPSRMSAGTSATTRTPTGARPPPSSSAAASSSRWRWASGTASACSCSR